jgi:hypothetical protein
LSPLSPLTSQRGMTAGSSAGFRYWPCAIPVSTMPISILRAPSFEGGASDSRIALASTGSASSAHRPW